MDNGPPGFAVSGPCVWNDLPRVRVHLQVNVNRPLRDVTRRFRDCLCRQLE